MDNFYIRFSRSLEEEEKDLSSSLLDYKYETLYLGEENVLKLRNKHTQNERELGTISSQILNVNKSEDEKYTIIVTQDDILLFDRYFDLIESLELDLKNSFIETMWGDEEFVVVFTDKLMFFDTKMKLLGENTSYEFSSVCFRKKYNLFVCATKEKIVFIESNGLKHGEHLNVVASYVSLIGDDVLVCASLEKKSDLFFTAVELFYSKNFYWYKKQRKVLEGEFLEVKNSKVYLKTDKQILEYSIVNKIDAVKNNFYVVDGCKILYSDLNNTKIPPPLCNLVLNCKKAIHSLDIQENNISVLLRDKILNFDKRFNFINNLELDKDGVPEELEFTTMCGDKFYGFIRGKVFLFKENNCEELNFKELLSNIWKVKEICCVNEKFIPEIYTIDPTNNVIDMRIYGDEPCLLLQDGSVVVKGIVFKLNLDFLKFKMDVKLIDNDLIVGVLKNEGLFLIKISTTNTENEFFDRAKKALVNANKKSDVTGKGFKPHEEIQCYSCVFEKQTVEIIRVGQIDSFFFDSRSFIFIKNNFMNISVKNSHQLLFADPEFKILGCTDLEVFGETRHGTFETFYPKSFSDIFVQKLIKAKDYKKAFEKANNDFNIFLSNKLDIRKLSRCSNSTLTSFLLEVSLKFIDYRIILENEEIEQLREELDDEIYLNDFRIGQSIGNKHIKITTPALCELLSIKNNVEEKLEDELFEISEDCQTNLRKTAFLNNLLRYLDPVKQFDVILFIFVKFKRTDLAVKISQLDIQRGIKYLMTITTKEDIKRSVIASFDLNLISDVYRIIQQDASDVINFIELGGNVEFRLSNFIEDRQNAVYYLVCELLKDDKKNLNSLEQYVRKYVLGRELLVCSCSKRFESIREILLELYGDTTTNHLKAIKTYKYLNKTVKLVDLYIKKNMFREAIEEYKGKKEDIYSDIKMNMERTGLFYELGCFFEEYEKDVDSAIKNYLKSKRLCEVNRLLKTLSNQQKKSLKNKILSECGLIMKTQLSLLDNIFNKYKKYRDRLKTVNTRGDDYFNDETSFSFSVLSEKSRGRPGGIYEKEFLLEKLASLGIKICAWREENGDLLDIFRSYENVEDLKNFEVQFEDVRSVLRSEYYDFFKDDDYASYDNTKKQVKAPDLSKYI